MPFGLTSITVPLALSRPKIAEGSLPSTRLRITLLAEGCTKFTVSLAAMLKPDQLTMARELCWKIFSVPGAPLVMLAEPATTWPPVGLA